MNLSGFPPKQGLYDPRFEKDSCGVGLVAHLKGQKSRQIVTQALQVLENLYHRGAQGADPLTGDGAGILVQIPHLFFESVLSGSSILLPGPRQYAVGMAFFPKSNDRQNKLFELIKNSFLEKDLSFLGWRDVPVASDQIGVQARESEPCIRQFFIARGELDDLSFERKLYLVRRKIENTVSLSFNDPEFHILSLSPRTLVYKGLLLPSQVSAYYLDLQSEIFESAIGLVHSRFSTNTFPSWRLAHPYRYLCHNGEINTIQGNINWMRSRQGKLISDAFGEDLSDALPIISENQSDSACLDNALEFLVLGGRSLAQAMMMLIPEPWGENSNLDSQRRGFYQFQSSVMEPWDGPAAVCFTDGRFIGATLDRNGLRPCRYQLTTDDRVILASETGVLPLEPSQIRAKGRLEPGKMFLIDTENGCILDDEEIKTDAASRRPYSEWVKESRITLEGVREITQVEQTNAVSLRLRQKCFGYSSEEIKMILTPMAVGGEEPTSSMGNDTPLAVLSNRPQLLFRYFRQLFAQVTNPPIDPIRESLVMSLVTGIGPRPNLLEESPEGWRQIKVQQPILSNEELEKIRSIQDLYFKSTTLKMVFRASDGARGIKEALDRLCQDVARIVQEGCRFVILSDRGVDENWAPIPSLLATSAVHHYLVNQSLRAECGLIVETGEARDVHHFACLIGYGAGSINPYLAFETLAALGCDQKAQLKYIQAVNKGLLKICSKLGISTIQSYTGGQLFEAIGLSSQLIQSYFEGTPSRIEGIGIQEIAEETLLRHKQAFRFLDSPEFESTGDIHYRINGEHHEWNPKSIASLQHATQTGSSQTFREFSREADGLDKPPTTLRALFDFRFQSKSISLEEVEPASEIVKRFTTGAMSFGALSQEAHETLAIAMNRIGAKSNSGEGGEDSARFIKLPNGDWKNSAIKQVASARFGVTAHYLVNAREIQIKMAQGAKPGEGGQLPGPKVDATIAKLRFSTPGVGLISPPPHHDIYSIEDLKQLIFDLKNVNPSADISVKLVSEVGVGTVAAGVVKANADKILISGDSGGTGASPLSSIKYAGAPWELGLAETHQTLLLNGLRDRVKLETDGQMKTGRDVAIAALLGAEEYGFSTAPLIVEGCLMMRKCHLNTCPVGVATQDPVLREKFKGKPENLINYFFFVAEELREIMSQLGIRRLNDMIGRTDLLTVNEKKNKNWKTQGLDLSSILYFPLPENLEPRYKTRSQTSIVEDVLDLTLIEQSRFALEKVEKITLKHSISNRNRAIGAMLSGEIAKRWGAKGLTEDSIDIELTGSAGQSFGAFLSSGVTLRLVGESNDYIGKGLSGGKIIVTPPQDSLFTPENTIIVGNTSLYGATSGQAFIRGQAGERFAVRNSGARAVVEGIGDHGCEYMTGGCVVVLGPTGRNFAAGMSGGIAYLFAEQREVISSRCNIAMVELEELTEPEDESELYSLVESHFKNTGSAKAKKILDHWKESLLKFVKVMPTDYKRALLALKEKAHV